MAKKWARQITKSIILTVTVLLSISFLLTNLSPYISPENYPLMGFLALASPYFIPFLLLTLFFWLFAKPFFAVIPFLTLIIGYQQIAVFFAFQLQASFTKTKQKQHLRIVNWNIQGFNGLTTNKNSKKLIRNEVVASITKLNPDVICLQEFNNSNQTNNIDLFTNQYPYYYYSKDYSKQNSYTSGNIIFSKYPIISSKKIHYPKSESLIYVDVLYHSDTIRIFKTLLKSFN
ncbi:MAG: endonuclease/exonuclease/phosphatase family protein [Chitinophagaceae bacterium]